MPVSESACLRTRHGHRRAVAALSSQCIIRKLVGGDDFVSIFKDSESLPSPTIVRIFLFRHRLQNQHFKTWVPYAGLCCPDTRPISILHCMTKKDLHF